MNEIIWTLNITKVFKKSQTLYIVGTLFSVPTFEIIGQQWLAKFTVCLQPHGSSSSRVCTRCVGRVGLSSSCASWDLRTIQFLAWIVKEGRPLPQDEVRMFLASVQSRPRARGGNITTTTKHSSPNKKKHSAKWKAKKKYFVAISYNKEKIIFLYSIREKALSSRPLSSF